MAAVLIVLVTALVAFRGLGALGVTACGSWRSAARYALAVMLGFTGSAHLMPAISEELVRMVPPWVPDPRLAVFATGVVEILGAVGLLIPRTQRVAGLALVVFFVAVFPANIHAAQAGVILQGQPATALWLRAPIQLLFMWLAWWSTTREGEARMCEFTRARRS